MTEEPLEERMDPEDISDEAYDDFAGSLEKVYQGSVQVITFNKEGLRLRCRKCEEVWTIPFANGAIVQRDKCPNGCLIVPESIS